MHRIIGLILFSSSLSNALPFPFPAVPTVAPIAHVPALPLVPTPGPLASGFNNPYYNYAGVSARNPAVAIPILTYSSEHGLDGNYAFSFTTADGKQAQETGYLKDAYIDNAGEPQGTQVVQGSYAYISPEGTPIQVSYVADENGFRPSGVHIPADGKAIIPPVVPPVDKNIRPVFDPAYNQYNPFGNRNSFPGQYNNGRPYDPRYPYNPARVNPYLNNPTYNPYQNSPHFRAKEEAK